MQRNVGLLALAMMFTACAAQMPGLGWCPDKRAMPGFDIDKYLGTWYEAERYFTVLEAGSRCARTNYTKATDGRILVSNELINRLTGVKRALDGEIRNIPKGGVDSKITVKYSTLPFPMETTYIILDTDYDSYAVVWSCSGIGLVNTQSAWVMTRERLPQGTVLQKAYGVLDKHKISRTFFVRADQEDCYLGEAVPDNSVTTGQVVQPQKISYNPQYQSPGQYQNYATRSANAEPEASKPTVESAPVAPAVAGIVPAASSPADVQAIAPGTLTELAKPIAVAVKPETIVKKSEKA